MVDPEPRPHRDLAEALVLLAGILLSGRTLGEILHDVIRVAAETVPGCDGASVSLLGADGVVTTPAATDRETFDLDELQYATGEGPCLQAIISGGLVRVDDFATERRFRIFGPLAARRDTGSCLSVPLEVGEDRLGGLNLYGRAPRSYGGTSEMVATRLAPPAAVIVANAVAYNDSVRLADQLHTALISRAEIEQAKGILMAQSHLSPDEAFDALRRASQRENIKLREIAHRVVTGRTGPNERGPTG